MKTTFHAVPRVRHLLPGFSLIETVLALGIMSLAITALLGLLPHGIEMSQKAANASAQSRIIDMLQNKLSVHSFASLSALQDQTLHFNDQGEMLDGTGDMRDSAYVVRVHVTGSVGADVRLPGTTTAEQKLLKFQIQIVATPLLQFDFDSAPLQSYQSVPLLIAPFVP